MMKHMNALALALLHLPFESRAFNTIVRAGIFERHSTQPNLCSDHGLRLRMVDGGKIIGKSASFRCFSLKDTLGDRNRFPNVAKPNVKSFSTKMTANDVFNVQQDWQDLKRSIQAIEPKYRSSFCQQMLCRIAALILAICRAFQSSIDKVLLLDKIKECEGLSAGTLASIRFFFPGRYR
jgi:hypothetical protein